MVLDRVAHELGRAGGILHVFQKGAVEQALIYGE